MTSQRIDSVVRSVHLVLGVAAFLFLLMYAVSSVQMAHFSWSWQVVDDSQVPVRPEEVTTPRALAQVMVRDHGLRGELTITNQGPNQMSIRLARPGAEYDVRYQPGNDRARIVTRDAGFFGRLNRIHHVSGLWRDDPVTQAWGLLAGIVSVVLLLLGLSGLWLWFRIHEERLIGVVLLAASLVVGIGLAIAIHVEGL